MAQGAICRKDSEVVGRGNGGGVLDRLVADRAVVLLFWEMTRDAVAIERTLPSAAMGPWFCVLVTLHAGIFLVADATGVAIPGGRSPWFRRRQETVWLSGAFRR